MAVVPSSIPRPPKGAKRGSDRHVPYFLFTPTMTACKITGAVLSTAVLSTSVLGSPACSKKLWATGENNSWGQFGAGPGMAGTKFATPVHVATSDVGLADVSAGTVHSAIVELDGTAWTAGWNYNGRLGHGDDVDRPTFTKVEGISSIISAVAGYRNTFFLTETGHVYAAGENSSGELGVGDATDRLNPVLVPITNVVHVAAGSSHTVFLKSDGTVFSTGRSRCLGDDFKRYYPTQITALSNVIQVEVGAYHSVFLSNDGTAWSCGYNGRGSLGVGDNNDRDTPFQVSSLSLPVRSIAASEYATLFLLPDGTVFSTGRNWVGELGAGLPMVWDSEEYDRNIPGAVLINGVKKIFGSTGSQFHFIQENGKVWATGQNKEGELGVGDYTNRNFPVEVTLATEDAVSFVDGGYDFTIFLIRSSECSEWPSWAPTLIPSATPTISRPPTKEPSASPSRSPTKEPSARPSAKPTNWPTKKPTDVPTTSPSVHPTVTAIPTSLPSSIPSEMPIILPTDKPSEEPTRSPSAPPTHTTAPSFKRGIISSQMPTSRPTRDNTQEPTISPFVSTSTPSLPPVTVDTPSSKPSEIPSNMQAESLTLPTQYPSETTLPTYHNLFEEGATFEQDLSFAEGLLSVQEINLFEDALASLTQSYGANGGQPHVITASTVWSQFLVDSSRMHTAHPQEDGMASNNFMVRITYSIMYISARVDVTGYPDEFISYMNLKINRDNFEARLVDRGIHVVAGTSTTVTRVAGVTISSPSPTLSPTVVTPSGSGSIGTIIGIAAAAAGLVAIICGVGYLRYRKRQIQVSEKSEDEMNMDSVTEYPPHGSTQDIQMVSATVQPPIRTWDNISPNWAGAQPVPVALPLPGPAAEGLHQTYYEEDALKAREISHEEDIQHFSKNPSFGVEEPNPPPRRRPIIHRETLKQNPG